MKRRDPETPEEPVPRRGDGGFRDPHPWLPSWAMGEELSRDDAVLWEIYRSL